MMSTRNVIAFLFSAVFVVSSGCSVSQNPPETTSLFDFNYKPPGSFVAKGFDDTTATGPAKMESAVELADKYAKLSDQMAALRQEKRKVETENKQLKKDAADVQQKLHQTQKELADANILLREMVVELNNWKSNIMGFRDEMRNADKAQLEALLKILQALGGDVTGQVADITQTKEPAIVTNKPQSQQASTQGQVHE